MQATIIGLNQIGTSIGMCLRVNHRSQYHVVGYESDSKLHGQAENSGGVDKAEWNLDVAVREADIVVVNVPVNAAYGVLENISPYLKEGATVTDTCDTKRSILHWADQLLPDHASFVGGNPLVKTNASGTGDPSPHLFAQSPYAIVPSPTSAPASVGAVQSLCQDLGARPLFMDPAEHDSFTAAMVGIPALASAAAINSVAASPSWHEISKFIGSEFVSISEPMSRDPSWTNGMASTNRDMLLHWLGNLQTEVAKIKAAIEDESSVGTPEGPLADMLVNAWENRLRLELGITPKPPTSMSEAEPVPSSGETMMSMMFGGLFYRVFNRNKRSDDPTKYDRNKL